MMTQRAGGGERPLDAGLPMFSAGQAAFCKNCPHGAKADMYCDGCDENLCEECWAEHLEGECDEVGSER